MIRKIMTCVKMEVHGVQIVLQALDRTVPAIHQTFPIAIFQMPLYWINGFNGSCYPLEGNYLWHLDISSFIRPCKSWTDARFGVT